EQHCAEKTKFQTKMENVLKENDHLLTRALSVEIVNIVVNDCINVNCLNVDACEHCVTTESELKTDFIKKENYETLLKQYHSLEKHCISLELNNQLNTEIFQIDTVSSSESALCLNVDACEHCVTTESELKTDFIKKENYETLLKQYHTLEKHCISLELNDQLNTEIFQRDNVSSSKSTPTFAELFETNELKAQIQEKDTVISKLKEKIKSSSGDVKERK
nr:hypothetical protein [Tanacetum cinerariifolium]